MRGRSAASAAAKAPGAGLSPHVAAMVSEHIGHVFSVCRDAVARGLVRIGLRPNHITILGMVFTVAAGVAVAAGRAHWRPLAVGLLVGAGACDMLDGAMANLAGLATRFGAILDSVCDRVSDTALFFGIVFYYALHPDAQTHPPNLTLAVLGALGLLWAYLTSYVRAKAREEGAQADGGFWQRGERVVTLVLGLAFLHLATAVWILGIFPVATVAHRLWRARRTAAAGDAVVRPPGGDDPRGLLGVILFRWPRGTLPFDIQAGVTVALLVFVPVPEIDPLGRLLAHLLGA